MTTLNDLIASIHTSLHSYSGTQEQMTWLTANCDSDDITLTIASSDTILRGIAEIEDELIYVNTTSASGLVLPPFGRGFRGSTAAAHLANAQVTFDPVFPRVEIRRAIDQCIQGLFPALWRIRTADLTYSVNQLGYELPVDCEAVSEVKVSAIEPLEYWEPVSRWKFDGTSAETTGRVLNIMDDLVPGSTVRVVYRARFGVFAAGTDTLTSVGLSESYADLILYCVGSRLLRFLEPARLQIQGVENISRSQVVAAGDASKIANQLYSMYQQRLAEERGRLLELTPPQINFSR